LVYTLSPIVGGREQVINAPAVDLLGYLLIHFETLEQEANTEKQRLYLNHLSRMHANPQDKNQAKANKKFMKNIEPGQDTSTGRKTARSNDDLQWDDIDKLKRIENS
jgi:Tfp pilus assembly protein PilV